MIDLSEDIRDLMEEGIRPVTSDEVRAMMAAELATPRRSARRMLALTAGAVVMLVIVLIVALVAVPSDTPAARRRLQRPSSTSWRPGRRMFRPWGPGSTTTARSSDRRTSSLESSRRGSQWSTST